ncbi:flavodoxin [uncultured Megasphaera sp.]|uniref:flavodoxin n=1 Tax=uncultured Megasphaera sp. TaxID=165188 RepID=UPI0025983914|nr:flavodoxin [uncultured Megasphaera sp.]
MKKFWQHVFTALMLTALMVVAGGCGGADAQKTQATASASTQETKQQPQEADTMKKGTNSHVLIAYYSLTGTTKQAAEAIQAATGGDLVFIEPADPYPQDHDPCLARQMADIRNNARPAVATQVKNMDQHDTIFVGYPIWYYQAPLIINTFLESYNLQGKRIIPFCTSGGYPIDKSITILKDSAPQATWEQGLRVSGKNSDFTKWLAGLGFRNK